MSFETITTRLARLRPGWLVDAKVLFIVLLIISFFILGMSMVHHRFFEGGYINSRGTLMP